MEVTGILKLKYDTNIVSGKFQKRDFVLATDLSTLYPQFIIFQVTQDKCSMLDQFNEGDEIKVQFNLRGREWNGPQGIKYFNTIDAWKISLVPGNPKEQQRAPTQPTPTQPEQTFNAPNNNDDLPF